MPKEPAVSGATENKITRVVITDGSGGHPKLMFLFVA